MNILLYIALGIGAGTLGRLTVSGNAPGGWIASITMGLTGAFAGGLAGGAMATSGYGHSSGSVLALVAAIWTVFVYHVVVRTRATRALRRA